MFLPPPLLLDDEEDDLESWGLIVAWVMGNFVGWGLGLAFGQIATWCLSHVWGFARDGVVCGAVSLTLLVGTELFCVAIVAVWWWGGEQGPEEDWRHVQ